MAASAEEAAQAARALNADVFVKAQVLSGGRGKAGGVKRAESAETARRAAQEIFALSINSEPVKRVLVEEALPAVREYYIALTIDSTAGAVQCIVSAEGGMDIEEIARIAPKKIVRFLIQPSTDGLVFDAHDALTAVFGDPVAVTRASGTLSSMIGLFHEKDCSLVEINPLIMTTENRLAAADAKIVIDDNALFKHPDLEALRNDVEYSGIELSARKAGLSYVGLDGSIGCMVNGAGLAMATADLLAAEGGRPSNFLDVGGGANPEKVLDALTILLSNDAVKVVLINIFGGITRCDDIARGIVMALDRLKIVRPLVVRLIGTNEKEGHELLKSAGIIALTDMTAAIKQAAAFGKAAA